MPRPSLSLPTATFALAAVLSVGGALVQPHGADGPDALTRLVADHPDRWLAGWVLQLLGAALLLPGITALMSVRGRLAGVGGTLVAAGAVGSACAAATELMLVPVTDAPVSQVLPVVQRMDSSPALAIVYLLALPGVLFGPPLLVAGLARLGDTSWVIFTVVLVTGLAAFVLSGSVLGTAAGAVQLVCLTALVAQVSRRTQKRATPSSAESSPAYSCPRRRHQAGTSERAATSSAATASSPPTGTSAR